jgi:uncharacterized coiled-coil protein SlyX
MNAIIIKMNAIINKFTQMSKQFYEQKIELSFTRDDLDSILIYGVGFLAMVRASWFIYTYLLWPFALFVWSTLTPGQKVIELASILTSIGTFAFVACIFNDFEQGLDKAFAKLKKDIADKTIIIAEQEEKIAKLEAIIAEVTNLSGTD